MLFIEYPKCSTCCNAKKFLDSNNIKYTDRNIVTETPSAEELENWVNKFNIPIKKLFNTSGLKYKALNLKDKLESMSDSEKYQILASDGMLIKRPLLVMEDRILIGFKVNEWETIKK